MAYTQKDHVQKVNDFEDICFQLRDLFDKKNWDYQDSFSQSFAKWGLAMSCIRLGDKLNRLESFASGKDIKVDDERVEDTLADLASYSIMTLLDIRARKQSTEE